MKLHFLLILLSFVIHQYGFAQTEPLFKVESEDKIGYINATGKEIIKPKFRNGFDFNEGLAPVRLNGYFGFIDSEGKFIIEPKYDYATHFLNGIALVHQSGTPIFIDYKGKQVLDTLYSGMSFISPHKAIIRTRTNKSGFIDIRTGKLIIDTLYHTLDEFKNGFSVVSKFEKIDAKEDHEFSYAVFDTLGNQIVKFGTYSSIGQFNGGFARVAIEDPNNVEIVKDGVIDTKGNLVLERLQENDTYIYEDFQEGLAVIALTDNSKSKKKKYFDENRYYGYINLKGKIVFNDKTTKKATSFSSGRAFIQNKDEKFSVINKSFKPISELKFDEILNDGFEKNFAIVKLNDNWGIIDTAAHFIVLPKYEQIHEVGIIDSLFFYGYKFEDSFLYGMADLNRNVILNPIIQDFDREGFKNGILTAVVNDRLTYINQRGDIIWQAKKNNPKSIKKLNIDYMMRGYFIAYSTLKNLDNFKEESGGWYVSRNIPKSNTELNFKPSDFSIFIDTVQAIKGDDGFLAYKVFVINATEDTVHFEGQDSRLYMKLQAQDTNGKWKDIEYIPNSWCGNSYHQMRLEPNHHWQLMALQYEGDIKTKIRAELKYISKENPEKEQYIYSNIINGSVNPAQFWNRRTYYPSGLMDPYNE
jgi:hypothetical protein